MLVACIAFVSRACWTAGWLLSAAGATTTATHNNIANHNRYDTQQQTNNNRHRQQTKNQICCVFAQLTVNGRWEGPHVFVVRLRDDAGAIMPGVRIKDMGPKMGLNGVDNGQIWFDRVRVPR